MLTDIYNFEKKERSHKCFIYYYIENINKYIEHNRNDHQLLQYTCFILTQYNNKNKSFQPRKNIFGINFSSALVNNVRNKRV